MTYSLPPSPFSSIFPPVAAAASCKHYSIRMSTSKLRLVTLGGGLSSLIALVEAHSHGVSVDIIEKDTKLGNPPSSPSLLPSSLHLLSAPPAPPSKVESQLDVKVTEPTLEIQGETQVELFIFPSGPGPGPRLSPSPSPSLSPGSPPALFNNENGLQDLAAVTGNWMQVQSFQLTSDSHLPPPLPWFPFLDRRWDSDQL